MAKNTLGKLFRDAEILQQAAKRLTRMQRFDIYEKLNSIILQILHEHLNEVQVSIAANRPQDWFNHLAVMEVAYGAIVLKIPVPELSALDWELSRKVRTIMNTNQSFLDNVEQAAFKLAAEGKNPTMADAIRIGLLHDEWTHSLPAVISATKSLESVKEDLGKQWIWQKHGEGGSVIKYWVSPFIERPIPTLDELAEAYERGLARYKAAMEKPIPDDWTWDYVPPDSFLARFPEQVYIYGNRRVLKFWMYVYDGEGQFRVLHAGQKISPPWYAHEAFVGYGDTEERLPRGKQVEIGGKAPHQYNLCHYQFVCPTPAELYAHLKNGGTVEELIHQSIRLQLP